MEVVERPSFPRATRRTILLATLVFLALASALACFRVAHDVPSVAAARAGIAGPFAAWLGVPVRAVALSAWLGAWALSIVAAFAVRDTPRTARIARTAPIDAHPPTATPARFALLWRAAPWLAALSVLVLLGIALRAHAAAWSPWDIDEPWAFPSTGTLFDDGHDALVHPPLYRALVLGWGALAGWTTHAPRWLIRLPSLVSGSLALALIATLALPRPSPRALLAVLLATVATVAIAVSALARPYGLATLAVVLVVAIVLDAAHRRLTPLEAALCVLSVSLAAWTDLIAGLVALLALAVCCATDARAGRTRDAAVLALCAAIPALPLAPGVLRAWRTGIDPASSTIAGPLPDLLPDAHPLAATYDLLAATAAPLPPLAALVLLSALLLLAWTRGARAPAVLLALACAVPLILAQLVALRARHLAWLPLLACAVLAILPPPLPKRAP